MKVVIVLLLAAAAQICLHQGLPLSTAFPRSSGGEVLYRFTREVSQSLTLTVAFAPPCLPQLYLAWDFVPSPSSYLVKGRMWPGNRLAVPVLERMAGWDYYALVTSDSSCSFNITLSECNSTAEVSRELSEGDKALVLPLFTPVNMSLQQDSYLYYQYTSTGTADFLTFQLTPLAGEPNLYISKDSHWPTKSNYQKTSKASNVFGKAVFYIRGQDGVAIDGTYYIAVHSPVPAYCTLTVDELYLNTNSYIDLYDGQPQLGNLYSDLPGKAPSSSLCYRFQFSKPPGLRPTVIFSITPIHGAFAMFAYPGTSGVVCNQLHLYSYMITQPSFQSSTLSTAGLEYTEYALEVK